jgi:hypothetical protein
MSVVMDRLTEGHNKIWVRILSGFDHGLRGHGKNEYPTAKEHEYG